MRLTHVVCTDAFAGVEQYIAYVSRQQRADGHAVTVLGGSEPEMRSAIGDVDVAWGPARSVFAAQRALLRTDADVIHVHMTAAEIAAVSTKPLHRKPIVATLHFAQPRGGDRRRARWYRSIERFLDAQVAISEFVASRADVACDVIPNGIPWELPTGHRGPVVLVAQRLEEEKDTTVALDAWARADLAARGWRLDVAGQGSQLEALIAHADELGISESVAFLGFVPDVKERMTRASVFLATAPEEPFGLSVVEAMAAGTPVVATAGGAHVETIGVSARQWLFEPGSAEACADALLGLAEDRAERDRYGRVLHERWSTTYSIEHHCAELEAVYRRVLKPD
jgi:glycosyltransferase involved in cell wall biosynthesis